MEEHAFDGELRRALNEALRQDWDQALERPEQTAVSPRQRGRMEQMLADPSGYYRAYTAPQLPQTVSSRTKPPKKRTLRPGRRLSRMAAAAVIAALLAGSALANSLTGGQFFRQLFQREAGNDPIMNADQLLEMSGANVGQALDTRDFRFELVDAVSSGNTAMIAVRVTARTLDGFPAGVDGAVRNYQFRDMDGTLLGDGVSSSSWHYAFPDQDPTLGENQFLLFLSLTNWETIPAGTYRLTLHDFVYTEDFGEKATVVRKGDWTVEIALGDGSAHSRTLVLDRPIPHDGCAMVLGRVAMTPLSMTLDFQCDGGSDACVDWLFDSLGEAELVLAEGTVLDHSRFFCGCSSAGGEGHYEMTVNLEFDVPLTMEAIRALTFGDQRVEFPPPPGPEPGE